MTEPAPRSRTVLVLAPSGRDGMLAERVLMRWNVSARALPSMDELCAAVDEGAGAIVVAEEVLYPAPRRKLMGVLECQPSWSDVPIIVLTAEGELSRAIAAGVEALAAKGNVTLLERPVRIATLVTAVRSALRARERQYDVRDYLLQLNAAREAAESANLAKSEFLAVMSHELRTPLNAIGGYAQLMQLEVHGPLTTEQHRDLDRIQQSHRHLLGVINSILNYARVERGAVRYEMADVPVGEALETCRSLLAPQAAAKGLKLTVRDCGALAARADREKLRQIVINLLSNAVKFTEPGGAITVECAPTKSMVTIRVIDTGRGIVPAKLAEIFEPFVQVDARLTRANEGVGLGLAISRDLARGMGGDLTVISVPGHGSTFSLTLPRARATPRTAPAIPTEV